MRSLRKTSAALMLTLALSACATNTVTLPNPDSLYPVEMTTCADLPPVPARPAPDAPRSEDDKATYVGSLRFTAVDCKDTVGDWAARRDRYVEQWNRETHNAGERLWRRVTGTSKDTSRH